jgi:hypothetical protein
MNKLLKNSKECSSKMIQYICYLMNIKRAGYSNYIQYICLYNVVGYFIPYISLIEWIQLERSGREQSKK